MFDLIKQSLPNFPDEAINDWLLPIAKDGYGWPPPSDDLGKWYYALGRKSLDYWGKASWKLQTASFELKSFCPFSQMAANGIVSAHFGNQKNSYSNLTNGRARMMNAMQFMLQAGTWPKTPIFAIREDKLETLDGNHRLAALTFVRSIWADERKFFLEEKNFIPPSPLHSAWILIPPSDGSYEKVPLTERRDALLIANRPSLNR